MRLTGTYDQELSRFSVDLRKRKLREAWHLVHRRRSVVTAYVIGGLICVLGSTAGSEVFANARVGVAVGSFFGGLAGGWYITRIVEREMRSCLQALSDDR